MIEQYTEIKIFTHRDYGYSVEDYHKEVGGDGITIESFEFIGGEKKSIKMICLDEESAVLVAEAILKLCKK